MGRGQGDISTGDGAAITLARSTEEHKVRVFLEGLPDGSVVHLRRKPRLRQYRMYERCVVSRTPQGVFLSSVGLVGQWPAYSLPHRDYNGDIAMGSHGDEKTLTRVLKKMDVPLPVSSQDVLEMNVQGAAPDLGDPISLAVPDMTPDEAASHWNAKLAMALQFALKHSANPTEFMGIAEQLIAMRGTPFPEGQPTLERPAYPRLAPLSDLIDRQLLAD
jgi:hypothetical protein